MKAKLCVVGLLTLLSLSFLSAQPPVIKSGPVDGPPEGKGLGYKPPDKAVRQAVHHAAKVRDGGRVAQQVKTAAPPAKFDCVDVGWVPPMRDQGSCGSCYLVSTCDAVTCAFIKAGYQKNDDTFKISDQFGMDCHNFGGCGGGWGAEVVDWMVKNGFPAEYWVDIMGKTLKEYPPYEARSRACRKVTGAKYWKPAAWGFARADQGDGPATVMEIKAAVMQYGVLNIALGAGGGFGSHNGTTVLESLSSNVDHEITLVGWDDSKGKGGAWKVRNQWGTGWGAGGYGWIGFGATNRIVDVFWVSAQPLPPPPPPPDGIVIAPQQVTMLPGATQQFTVTPAGNYSWSASGGGITNAGLYTAPSATGSYTVSVHVAGDPSKFAVAAVTVSSAPPPPPPPVPGVTLTLSKDLPAGIYQVIPPGFEHVPAGTLAKLREVSERIKELEAILDKLKEERGSSTEEPPLLEKKPRKKT